MFVFNLGYMFQLVACWSLFASLVGWKQLAALIAFEVTVVFAIMHSKDELLGYGVSAYSSFIGDYVFGLIAAFLYYFLTSFCPFLIAVAPCEQGPSLFSGIIFWRLFANCFYCFYAASFLEDKESWVSCDLVLGFYFGSVILVGEAQRFTK